MWKEVSTMSQCRICGTEEDGGEDFLCQDCYDKHREVFDKKMK